LAIRRDAIDRFPPATLDLHGARWIEPQRYELAAGARRYENFESNVAGQLGLGAALGYANGLGLSNIRNRIKALAGILRDELAGMPDITLRDKGKELCGIVTFTHEKIHASDIRRRLAEVGINVGTSFASSTLLDMRRRGIECLVRCAPHYFNTEEELSVLCERLQEIIR
jgi:selenocysteine lyase/cysteine desulfurase